VARQVVEATAHSAAAPERVWQLLADSSTWPEWGIWDARSLERQGSPPPEGVGAVRELKTGRVVVREEIVAFDPPRRVGYRLLSGLPVRDYEAEVTLEPGEQGSALIRWRAEFAPRLPGTGPLIRRRLQTLFEDVTRRLAAVATPPPAP
jgi:uncharacterized protein YndB with AHSA1/START domain